MTLTRTSLSVWGSCSRSSTSIPGRSWDTGAGSRRTPSAGPRPCVPLFTSRGLPRSVNNITWTALIAASPREGLFDKSFTRSAVAEITTTD